MRRVVVGVTGTLGSLAALHRAAAEARARDAELRVVLAWQSPGGELGSRNGLSPSALAECRTAAVERLREVLDTAFRAVKPGVALAGLTVRGKPGAVLVDTARGVEDLLVVGTGSRTPLRRLPHPPSPALCAPQEQERRRCLRAIRLSGSGWKPVAKYPEDGSRWGMGGPDRGRRSTPPSGVGPRMAAAVVRYRPSVLDRPFHSAISVRSHHS